MPAKQQKMSASGTPPKIRKREGESTKVNFSDCDNNFLARSLNNPQQTAPAIISSSPVSINKSCTTKEFIHSVDSVNKNSVLAECIPPQSMNLK
jgi:hypothetical protein